MISVLSVVVNCLVVILMKILVILQLKVEYDYDKGARNVVFSGLIMSVLLQSSFVKLIRFGPLAPARAEGPVSPPEQKMLTLPAMLKI